MKKTVLILLSALLLTGALAGCKKLVRPDPGATSTPTEDALTGDPDEILETSRHDAVAAASRTALEGGKVDDELAETEGPPYLFFAEKEGVLMAYSEAAAHEEEEIVRYELRTPAGKLPLEVAKAARKTIADKSGRIYDPEDRFGEPFRLFGYISEGSALLMDEPSNGTAASALFRKTEDGEWIEIPLPGPMRKQLSGGCMITDKVGFLCISDRAMLNLGEDYDPYAVGLMRTGNGGKTWKELELRIPDDTELPVTPPTYALTPRFDGEHGVLIVCYSTYDQTKAKYSAHAAVFESFDRGKTWEIRDDG